MNIEPVISIIVIISLILGISSTIISLYILKKFNNLLKGSNGKSLEKTINSHRQFIDDLIDFRNKSVEYFKVLDRRIKEKISSKQAVRFNPFQDGSVGGNNSFSVAFVDEEGNGSVLSSIHTRERTNVFIKPIKNWKSTNNLSEEEKLSLQKQKNS